MIGRLEIKNFKSIKSLSLQCRRINLLIGQPNTGKSNILEVLGFLSFGYYGEDLGEFVRHERMSHLFYDENLDNSVRVTFDDKPTEIKAESDGSFRAKYRGANFLTVDRKKPKLERIRMNELAIFKFYRFSPKKVFPDREVNFLLPPSGSNLLALLLSHGELRSMASSIFEPFGLRLVLRPQEDKIEVLKYQEDVLISYPYFLASDTLQRIIFHLVAVESNRDSVLAFEEPEAHAFPYYTKLLAERIALDEGGNQFFISTHNPYFLLSILEKAKKEDVSILLTYWEDYQTKVRSLKEGEKEEILAQGIDLFFNMERFLGK